MKSKNILFIHHSPSLNTIKLSNHVKKKLCNFSPNINLKSHSLVHTGVQPQRCTHCNYSANQGASLKKHILKHTGENPRHCQQCEHTSTLKVK